MAQHELEITISKTGNVTVHVKNVKGKACLEYANWIAAAIGNVEDQKLTSEYYEPETKAAVKLQQELRNQES